ncbi:MAG: shikimate kinase [bacterium]
MRIYLVGYMASGKSQVGADLAGRLGFSFVDLDDMFEERYRISIYDFFEKYSERNFRKIEQKLLHETASLDQVMVSTGGGTPCFFDNMAFIKSSGFAIYLRWNIPELVSRLRKVKRKRPLLKEFASKDFQESVTAHLREREFYYNQADYIFEAEAGDFDQVVCWIRSKQVKPASS